jgi:vibriolysin
MTRFARVSSTLLLTAAAFAGCTDEPTYNGAAKLQQVAFTEKAATAVKGDLAKASAQYVRNHDELTGYGDEWKARATFNTVGGGHVRLNQYYDGVKVFGGDIVVHSASGKFEAVVGNRVANLAGFNTNPLVSKETAIASAKGDYDAKITATRIQPEYSREKTELVILPVLGSDARLAWHVTFFTERQGGVDPGLWNYFYDAETGELLKKFNGIHTVVQQASGAGGNTKVPRTWTSALDVSKNGAGFDMNTSRLLTLDMNEQTSGGTIVTGGSLDNFGDAPINDAHGFAEVTLNFLDQWFGFDSIDNAGFQIKSRVHYDHQYENAFWDGTQMTYGDGAQTFFPLSGDVDVVAHEINHGFTTFHSNLIYSSQSGGMNESFSDISGTIGSFFINGDNGEFDIGRDVFKSDSALRFMCDPTADGISIDDLEDFTEGTDPHFSSGIQNKAFCFAARRLASGTTTGNATQASVRRAGEAYFRANAAYWTEGSTFEQGCQGVMDAAKELGFSTDELDALRSSWADTNTYCDGLIAPLHCDETITTDHGTISSPNFPANYPNNFKKTTCIIPASGASATLHFTNFDTEDGFDFVSIKNADGLQVANASGQTAPADVSSTTLVVKFTSDVIIARPGWKATW